MQGVLQNHTPSGHDNEDFVPQVCGGLFLNPNLWPNVHGFSFVATDLQLADPLTKPTSNKINDSLLPLLALIAHNFITTLALEMRVLGCLQFTQLQICWEESCASARADQLQPKTSGSTRTEELRPSLYLARACRLDVYIE